MKIAIIADLHGNEPALQAMDAALTALAPDEIWFLGDAVGKGPDNAATCDWVRRRCCLWVGGNWDYGIGGKQYAEDAYYWDQLGPERLAWLNSLPEEAEAWVSGIRFRLFHGRPHFPLITAADPSASLAPWFRKGEIEYGGVICADSHRPFIRTLHQGYLLNTGSVGNSLGVPLAHALILEGEKDSRTPGPLQMSVLSLPYDREEALRRSEADPDQPHKDAWQRELTTGFYSR